MQLLQPAPEKRLHTLESLESQQWFIDEGLRPPVESPAVLAVMNRAASSSSQSENAPGEFTSENFAQTFIHNHLDDKAAISPESPDIEAAKAPSSTSGQSAGDDETDEDSIDSFFNLIAKHQGYRLDSQRSKAPWGYESILSINTHAHQRNLAPLPVTIGDVPDIVPIVKPEVPDIVPAHNLEIDRRESDATVTDDPNEHPEPTTPRGLTPPNEQPRHVSSASIEEHDSLMYQLRDILGEPAPKLKSVKSTGSQESFDLDEPATDSETSTPSRPGDAQPSPKQQHHQKTQLSAPQQPAMEVTAETVASPQRAVHQAPLVSIKGAPIDPIRTIDPRHMSMSSSQTRLNRLSRGSTKSVSSVDPPRSTDAPSPKPPTQAASSTQHSPSPVNMRPKKTGPAAWTSRISYLVASRVDIPDGKEDALPDSSKHGRAARSKGEGETLSKLDKAHKTFV